MSHKIEVHPVNKLELIEKRFDEAIKLHSATEVTFLSGRKEIIFPFRVVYIEGVLSLVGEVEGERIINYYLLDKISEVTVVTSLQYDPKHGEREVDEFLDDLRSVAGNSVRLVLKIHSIDDINLNPKNQFIGNPYMVMNHDGELIWGGTVEISPQIFDWILEFGSTVEILDPISFKKEFLEYCELKLKESLSVA